MELLTAAQLEALRKFDTPTICNAIEFFGVRSKTEGFTRPELRLRVSMEDKPMIGYARTAVVSARFPAEPCHRDVMQRYYTLYENCELPQVAVIQDMDETPVGSYWGDVQAMTHRALGCIGAVTNGGVRDVAEVEKVGFYLFSKELLISHAYIHMVEAGGTVEVCGMRVSNGNLIHADVHGAIVIPHEIAPRLAEACQKAIEAENALLLPCREAVEQGRRVTADEVMAWRDEMVRRRAAALDG